MNESRAVVAVSRGLERIIPAGGLFKDLPDLSALFIAHRSVKKRVYRL